MENKINISIIGAGRFGSFFGEELSRFFDVVYFDKNKNGNHNMVFKGIDECLMRKIIFLAIPVSEIENFLIEFGKKISPGSLLVDLSSVKLKPKELFEKHLPAVNKFILTHPLFGPDSAKCSLEGHKIVITESRCGIEDIEAVNEILKGKLGVEIIHMTSDEHDRLMAYNLSLMHHLGRTFDKLGIMKMKVMMRSLGEIALITQFVMNDSPQLFRDFYRFNPYSHPVREQFEAAFKEITAQL